MCVLIIIITFGNDNQVSMTNYYNLVVTLRLVCIKILSLNKLMQFHTRLDLAQSNN